MLSTTLITGMVNGLEAESITIAWCKHYDPALASLLYNLRHSRFVDVAFLPQHITPSIPATYLLALSIPAALGKPNLPLLITEEDTIFTSDVSEKMFVVGPCQRATCWGMSGGSVH